ncbi:MAG: hypothetical protein KIT69_06260 [Propionibacteriaceae bacterium]|nr:hypothetical protein [Propionibacteriaceae bacterium]
MPPATYENAPSGTSHRRSRAILAVWVIGFLIGTTTHIVDLVGSGLQTYAEFPTALRLFWISLTVLDPITVVLLFLRQRTGIVLALIVILADIAVNWTVFLTISGNPLFGVVNQTVFAAFLLVTTPTIWRSFRGRGDGRADPESSSQET